MERPEVWVLVPGLGHLVNETVVDSAVDTAHETMKL